jgi:hypothetical protein
MKYMFDKNCGLWRVNCGPRRVISYSIINIFATVFFQSIIKQFTTYLKINYRLMKMKRKMNKM